MGQTIVAQIHRLVVVALGIMSSYLRPPSNFGNEKQIILQFQIRTLITV